MLPSAAASFLLISVLGIRWQAAFAVEQHAAFLTAVPLLPCLARPAGSLSLQYYKVIYAYMGFAMFNVFFFLTGALILQLLRLSGVHMDLVSFCFLLFNFSVRPAGCSGIYAWPRYHASLLPDSYRLPVGDAAAATPLCAVFGALGSTCCRSKALCLGYGA